MGEISRFDLPAQQNVINTYVPLPYQELAHSLSIKQGEYDYLKEATDKADNAIQALKAPQFIRTSTDFSPNGVVENPQHQYLKQKQEELNNQKQDLLNSGIDFTSPEGKKKVSQYIGAASSFYNNQGKQIEQDSKGIEEHNKNHDEYLKKGVHYAGNAYYSDRNVDKFLNEGSGFQTTSLNPYQERTKVVKDALEPIKSQVIRNVDKNGLVTLKDRESGAEVATIQNGRTIWKGVSGERVKNAVHGVINSELDEGIQREAASHVQYLLGKHSDKIFDKEGKIKKVTYETKDVNGKPIKLTDDADKYYYNKKYKDLRDNLQNYAINTFTSSDISDTQNNKILPEDYQNENKSGKQFGTVPTTTTPYGTVNQTSSSTPAKDAFNSVITDFKNRPIINHPYGGGKVIGKYEDKSYKEKLTDLKSNLISSIKDNNSKKKAEALFDHISNNKENIKTQDIKSIINEFDNRWQNVEADKQLTFVPTKDTQKIENSIGNFVSNIASGSTITNPKGEPADLIKDEEHHYAFAGLKVGSNGVSYIMKNTLNPSQVVEVHNKSNIGANEIGKQRNDLKEIGNEGEVKNNKILSGIVEEVFGENGKDYKFKVVTDPNSPNLIAIRILDKNNRVIANNVPEEKLDNITLESVALSMGSSGLGNTPTYKVK